MPEARPLRIRLLWFAGLWIAGVAAVSALAYGIRFWLGL
jgi:hypothetical protein